MQYYVRSGFNVVIAALLAAACCQAQDAPGAEPQARKGIPPRASAADYQSHAQAGMITIAADFTGHSIAPPDGVFNTEDFVAVEVALFGPAGSRLQLSPNDFSLRINGKKMPSPAQPYALIFRSLKDPSFEPASSNGSKAGKTTIGGSGNQNDAPAAPVKMPFPLQRAMEQKVQRAALPEGDRALPEAGLLFFDFHGKTNKIQSMELIYSGPAGKAVLMLQP